MIQISNKRKCCGCTACANICPKKCIEMQSDEEGFLYPIIDTAVCVNCGLCESVCPMNNYHTNDTEIKAVAVQHKDSKTLYQSASGGAFSAIASAVIEKGGVVFGAAYDENFAVHHCKTDTVDDLSKYRSSKYVQSNQGFCYTEVKKSLQEGRVVCYSGTPCQIAGLRSFLKKNYDNLILIDLVCKGVGSPSVLKQYLKGLEKKHGSKVQGLNFKRKTYGYHSSTMSVDFEDGSSSSCGGITDLMMRSFRANICLRPSCAECPFKGIQRVSDLTLFDCWHYAELTGKVDDDKGHTSILIHSKKGENLIYESKKWLSIDPIDSDEAVELDGIMVNNREEEHPKRKEFFEALNQDGLNAAIKRTIPISIVDRCKDYSKKILYKTGMLKAVKGAFQKEGRS